MPDDVGIVPGSVRYFVWLYAGRDAQPRLAALFAIEHEIAASLRPGLEHEVAHVRLAWWREECERLCALRPRHPQTLALLHESRHSGSAVPDLLPLLDAAGWDLARAVPATRAELERRCSNWARGLFRHLRDPEGGASDPAAPDGGTDEPEAWLVRVGSVIEELNGIGALRADARVGRLRVPLDALAALDAGATPLTPDAALTAEPFPAALGDYLRVQHRRLRARLGTEMASLAPHARPALHSALVWSALAAGASLRAERALPATRPAGRFDALRDNWSAWRAARRALTGRPPVLGAAFVATPARRDAP